MKDYRVNKPIALVIKLSYSEAIALLGQLEYKIRQVRREPEENGE